LKKKVKHITLSIGGGSSLRLFTLVIALAMAASLCSQTLPRDEYFDSEVQPREFDKEQWEDITGELEYTHVLDDRGSDRTDIQKQNQSNTNHNGTNQSPNRRYSGSASPFWVMFFKVLAVLIAVGVVAILLVHLLGGGGILAPRSRKIPVETENISIEEIEANIHESDLDRHIRGAVEKKNYALAIRLYYLAIIKELSLNKWIKWKRDKTNRDYLSEMRNTDLFKPYRNTTRIFERVWYGQAELGEQDFLKIKPGFVDLINRAKRGDAS